RPQSMRDGDLLVGWGMSTATYPAKRMPASALARLQDDGGIVIQAATHELGTGTYTSMAQIAAAALGVPVGRVRVELGDTAFPENPISAGSMTASSTGPAIDAAARALKAKIEARKASVADVEDCRRLVRDNGGRVIEASASVAPGQETKKYSMHSFGAVFADVRVDPDLGEIRVARIVAAYGAGRILNAKTARSQLSGG